VKSTRKDIDLYLEISKNGTLRKKIRDENEKRDEGGTN
jgi:hypothetical protein